MISDQCKEIEENNKMGKTRDLFKKIRDTYGQKYVRPSVQKRWRTMAFSRVSTGDSVTLHLVR